MGYSLSLVTRDVVMRCCLSGIRISAVMRCCCFILYRHDNRTSRDLQLDYRKGPHVRARFKSCPCIPFSSYVMLTRHAACRIKSPHDTFKPCASIDSLQYYKWMRAMTVDLGEPQRLVGGG